MGRRKKRWFTSTIIAVKKYLAVKHCHCVEYKHTVDVWIFEELLTNWALSSHTSVKNLSDTLSTQKISILFYFFKSRCRALMFLSFVFLKYSWIIFNVLNLLPYNVRSFLGLPFLATSPQNLRVSNISLSTENLFGEKSLWRTVPSTSANVAVWRYPSPFLHSKVSTLSVLLPSSPQKKN